MICLSCSYHRCVSTFRRRQPTRLGLTGMLNILIGILSLVPTRASRSLASLSVVFTSLDHCIDTLSATVRGGSLVRTRLSVRGHGVLPGFVCQRRSPGDTTLSELRQAEMLFKVGTLSYNWSTIGLHTHIYVCSQLLHRACPCPTPRVYPLPARTSRRLGGVAGWRSR